MPEWQTGKTLIRLLLLKQSDLGLRCLSIPFWQATYKYVLVQKQSDLGLRCLAISFGQATYKFVLLQKQSDLGLHCLSYNSYVAGNI